MALPTLSTLGLVAGLTISAPILAADGPPMRGDRLIVKLAAERPASVRSLIEDLGATRARPIVEGVRGPRRDEASFARSGLDRIYVIELSHEDASRVRRIVAELARAPGVDYAEPVYRYRLSATVPNDPLFPLQWGHENTGQSGGTPGADMNSTSGWDLGTGSPAGLIGILDTGVDQDHPDLAPNLVGGFDFSGSPEGLDDHFGHGTQVTGNAAARGNNSIGVAGTCWRCSVLTLKVFGSNGFLSLEEIVPAVIFGAESGADVLNMSFGELAWSEAFEDAVEYAAALGTLSLAASGNAGLREPLVPAALGGVVSVAGTTHDDLRLGSYGDHAEIAAPTNVTTTWPNANYFVFRGTSGAVPFASGLAGLLRATDPTLHVQELRQLLRLGAVDQVGHPSEDTPGWDPFLGYGRIDVSRSMSLAEGPWLALDRPHYVCGGTLYVDHKDLSAGDTVTALVTGSFGGDAESVVLSKVTAHGYYRGSVPLSQASALDPVVRGDGKLDVAQGETATAELGALHASATFDCDKRVCLDRAPDVASPADCDGDGVLDPGESWSFDAVFDNDHTESLEGIRIELGARRGLVLGAAVDVGAINPVDDRAVGPFTLGLPAGASAPGSTPVAFTVTGTGFAADAAGCAATGYPSGFSLTLDRDGDGPDTWTALPPRSPAASTSACPAIELTWSPVAGAASYSVYRSELSCEAASGASEPYADVRSTTIVDDRAAAGVTYHYAIEAREAGTTCTTLRSCAVATCPCAPPEDPTGLDVVRQGSDLWLSWEDPAIAGQLWSLYRAAAPDPAAFGPPLVAGLADVDPSSPGIQFADAAAAAVPSSFFYLVTALNACGESPLFTRQEGREAPPRRQTDTVGPPAGTPRSILPGGFGR